MDDQPLSTLRDDYWRLQEAVNELSATQVQHSERIMRLEKRHEDGNRSRSVWGPSSPFPSALGSSHNESALNPAAEAFRNFDTDPPNTMMSSLTLDGNEDARRAAASRANSVRFDESANNHYGGSRASMDIPTRTGSGLGSHPLSERSLSHRSERGSTSGYGRTNSFGLESSRLLGSIHNSPRVSGHPPPGFFVLGPCPSIVRCWLTETFSNDSLLYAALCSGSSSSWIGTTLVQKLGMSDSMIEENGLRKIKLLVYLTEAKIQIPSSRSASPAPQVPAVTVKFIINEQQLAQDKSIQIVIGSDVLREHSADIFFSQDKVMLYDDDRNQLSIPLIRPEDDAAYKNLATRPRGRRSSAISDVQPLDVTNEQSTPGVIGRPSRVNSLIPTSPTAESPSVTGEGDLRRIDQADLGINMMNDANHVRAGDDSKSTTGSEKSSTAPTLKSNPGVWSSSWRSISNSAASETQNNARSTSVGSYSRPGVSRPMKVLRPSVAKGMATATRTTSASSPITTNGPEAGFEPNQLGTTTPNSRAQTSAFETKPATSKPNSASSGAAFPWLSQNQPRKTTATK